MELVIPIMLFFLEIPLDNPEQASLTRHPAVFLNEQDCREAGRQLMQEMSGSESDPRVRRTFHCEAVPSEEEYDRMFEEMSAARRNRQEAGDE